MIKLSWEKGHNLTYAQLSRPTVPDQNLMSDSEIWAVENFEVVEQDPAELFALEMGLEFVDFCCEHLEDCMAGGTIKDGLNEEEFEVSSSDKIKIQLTNVLGTDC